MEKETVNVENISTKTVKTRKPSNTQKTKTIDDIKPSDRVEVRNLRAWDLSFIPRDGNLEQVTKGIIILPNSKMLFNFSEIEDQVNGGNELFCGIDGLGSHASLWIVDPLIREKVFGQPTDPTLLTTDALNDLLSIEKRSDFEHRLSELVVTNSEKRMIAIMCSNKNMYPTINTDDVPAYKLAAIERISGIKLD